MKMIKVTLSTGKLIAINSLHISSLEPDGLDNEKTKIWTSDGEFYISEESMENILKQIEG